MLPAEIREAGARFHINEAGRAPGYLFQREPGSQP
jgi:hypothetical protein